MARLRKFVCYRDHKRAYTRFSKYKKLCYVAARPANRISRYTGGTQENFTVKIHLVAKSDLQIRDSALESARQTSNRVLEGALGKTGYFFQMRCYPHHILRENPLASGAGADRLSTGMAHNYGKPIGIAARIFEGQPIFTIKTYKEHIPLARRAMKRAAYKLPCKCAILVEEIKNPSVKKTITKTPAKKAVAV
ncbi:MAG: 50S ribosomal protein L16 [Candidatus Woesearchaeota archaeon]